MEKGDAGPSGPASEPGENDSKFLADARGAFIRSENARNRLLRDGAAILDAMEAAFTRYVVLPSGHALVAVVLFTAATHAQPAWEHAVRLIVKSAVKRSGKTRLLEILSELAHNVLRAATASVAALVRSIEEANPPTIVLDEADVIFRPRKGGERREGAEDLRGSLNAGFRRGWKYLRWDPVANCRVECETFAMAALGGIGDFPDTIEDRGPVVVMRRRLTTERVEPFRLRDAGPDLAKLRDLLHAWVRRHLEELRAARPRLPVEDRAADVWEPLVAVADLAGGTWPKRAREAAVAISGSEEPEDASMGERLLADLQKLFDDKAKPALPTAEILKELHGFEEAPWADYYGHALSARDLARLLRPFGIRSGNHRLGSATVVKGYSRKDLGDAWERYSRYTATNEPPPGENGRSGFVAEASEKSATGLQQEEKQPRSGVAHVADWVHPIAQADRLRLWIEAARACRKERGSPGTEIVARLGPQGIDEKTADADRELLMRDGKVYERSLGFFGVVE